MTNGIEDAIVILIQKRAEVHRLFLKGILKTNFSNYYPTMDMSN